MTITIKHDENGFLHIVDGNARLQAALEHSEKVEVFNASTGTTMFVHQVEGELVALDAVAQGLLDNVTRDIIEKAKRPLD